MDTFFAENHQKTAFSSEGRIGKKTISYGAKIRVYVPIWARTQKTLIGLDDVFKTSSS